MKPEVDQQMVRNLINNWMDNTEKTNYAKNVRKTENLT